MEIPEMERAAIEETGTEVTEEPEGPEGPGTEPLEEKEEAHGTRIKMCIRDRGGCVKGFQH